MEETRVFLDPVTESEIRARVAPYERAAGGASRRLRAWVFEIAATGEYLCTLVVHRTTSLSAISETDLEETFKDAYSETIRLSR